MKLSPEAMATPIVKRALDAAEGRIPYTGLVTEATRYFSRGGMLAMQVDHLNGRKTGVMVATLRQTWTDPERVLFLFDEFEFPDLASAREAAAEAARRA